MGMNSRTECTGTRIPVMQVNNTNHPRLGIYVFILADMKSTPRDRQV